MPSDIEVLEEMSQTTVFRQVGHRLQVNTVKVSQATETTGPVGAVIDLDRSRADDGVFVVEVAGELDVLSVPRLRSSLDEAVGVQDVVIDLSRVRFCDSSVLRLLVDVQRASAAAGHTFEVAHPSEAVRQLFEVSGLRGVLHVTT